MWAALGLVIKMADGDSNVADADVGPSPRPVSVEVAPADAPKGDSELEG